MKQTMGNCFRIQGTVVEDDQYKCKLTGITCSKFDPAPACNVCRVPELMMLHGTDKQKLTVKVVWEMADPHT